LLDWRAEKNVAQMCVDQWRWQSLNPDGYRDCASASQQPVATPQS
jgi:hypothetical protein